MKRQILAILLAMLTGLLLYGCRHSEVLQTQTPPEPDPIRWVRFVPQEYVLRG